LIFKKKRLSWMGQWETTHQAEFSNPKTRGEPVPAASVKYNQHGFPKDQFKQSALATRDTGMGSEERSDRRAQYARLQVAVPGGQLIRLTTTRRHSRRLRQTMINVPSCRARPPQPPRRIDT
jgi:hypothetical protein